MSRLERLYAPPEIGAPGKRAAARVRRDLMRRPSPSHEVSLVMGTESVTPGGPWVRCVGRPSTQCPPWGPWCRIRPAP